MKVLIFGGRDFHDYYTVLEHVCHFQDAHGRITAVIHGNALGADKLGQRVAREYLGVPDLAFPADWHNIFVPGAVIRYNNGRSYNAAAGGVRNGRMLTEGRPDWGMGFPGGTGTADMLRRLQGAGVPVWDAGCSR